MKIRQRLQQIGKLIDERVPSGQLHLIVSRRCSGDQTPGVYITGQSARVFFEGDALDPKVIEPLKARLAPWGLHIKAGPLVIEPPAVMPWEVNREAARPDCEGGRGAGQPPAG